MITAAEWYEEMGGGDCAAAAARSPLNLCAEFTGEFMHIFQLSCPPERAIILK